MTTGDLAGYIQHTDVGATADRSRIEQLPSECETHGFVGAMIQPCWIPLAAERLAGADVSVCTALGGDRTSSTVTGIRDAVAAGADEIDVMANVGWLRSGGDGEATVERVRFIADRVDDSVGVKASGGVKTAAEARALLDAGADLLGALSGVGVVTGEAGEDGD